MLLALGALGLCARAWASPQADEHLLAGAKAFRAERYADALVEFRVAETLGAGPGARYYIAASLQKLGRAEEAVEAFAYAEETAPHERDALLDYYHALACYDVKLYTCADRLLSAVGERSGPRIGDMAAQVRKSLAPLLAAAPTPGNTDWYLAHATEAQRANRPRLAKAFLEEAVALASRDPSHHREAEAQARLGALKPGESRP